MRNSHLNFRGKSISLWVTVCFALALCSIMLACFFATNRHQTEFVQSRHSFGIAHQNEILTHSFSLTNRHADELVIEDILPSCTCVTVLIGARTLPPGESVTVTMNFETRNYSGHREVKTIIKGRYGRKKDLICGLVMDARIEELIEFQPNTHYLSVGEFDIDTKPCVKLFRMARGRYPLDWDEVRCRAVRNNFQTSISPTGPDKWELEVEIQEKAHELGAIFDTLLFSFKKDGKEVGHLVRKSIRARIRGPIMPVPRSLLLGILRPGTTVSRTISLRPHKENAEAPFRIISAECSEKEWITVIVAEDTATPSVNVSLTPTDRELGAQSGQITINYFYDDASYIVRVDFLARVTAYESRSRISNEVGG